MDIALPILKCAGTALAVALALLVLGRVFLALLPGRMLSGWLQPALSPVVFAVALISGYATVHAFPHASAAGPWYADAAEKMAPVAIALVGGLFALERLSPRWLGMLWTLALAAGVTVLVVRTKWEGWPYFAVGLAVSVVLTRMAYSRILGEERLALVGALIAWASVTAGAIVVMTWIDQRLGRMLIAAAVLGGVAVVASVMPFMRKVAAAGGAAVALMSLPLLALAAFYNEGVDGPTVPRAALVLLALAPLGAGITAIPAARRSLLSAMIASLLLTVVLAGAALVVALLGAPPVDAG